MAQSKPTGIHTRPIIHKGQTSYVWSLAFAPDGKSVVSGSADGTIRIWDAYSPVAIGQPVTGHTSHVHSVAYSPRSPMIASVGGDHIIRLWDTSTQQQIGTPLKGYPSNVSSIAFSPDGNTLAAGLDVTVRLWDVKARTPVSDLFKGHTAWVRAIAFHPDGTRIITGSDDKTVRIWDIERGSTVAGPLQGHTSWIRTIAMSPNGSKMISGSGDRTLRLWDTRSGAAIGQPFEGHTNALCCVRFSPNGVYVASGSWDKTVRVWDIRTGRQVDEPFEQHTSGVNSLAFSPNGKYIASGSDDMTVMIWGVSLQVTDQTSNPQDMMEENGDPLKEDSMNAVGQHMSVHDMFRLLSCHGCNDLSLQMDYNQNTAVLVSGGGFGDIWRGDLLDGTRVAIKTWREALIKTGDYKTLKRAVREIYYWSKMKHKNIHHLMGVVVFKGQSIGMVSEWMENGNTHNYLQKNPNADRLKLCIEVASGLAYIHSLDMVHGDIKGLNVLVSSDCAAKLTDFGISTMCQSSIVFSATTASQAGSVRWAAPELLSENPVKTKQSDLYALGMTILEVMSGTMPYPECTWDFNVMMKVSQGILPTRPVSHIQDDQLGNQLWDLLVSCWDRNPDARPSASQMAKSLTLISSPSM